MTTKAAFIAAMGGSLLPFGPSKSFVRDTGDIFTATAHGLDTGAGPFKFLTTGTVPTGLVAAVHAETFMTAGTIIATDVLNVDGKAYTIIATPAADGDVDLGANDSETLANIAAAINLDPGAASAYDIDMSANPDVEARLTDIDIITIRAKSLDASVANAIAVTSPDGTMVVDNATLENGVDGTDYFIIRLSANTFSVATTKALALAGTAVTISGAGTGVHTLQPTTDTLAESLEDVLLQVLTYPGARSIYPTANIAKFWQSAIDGQAAGDDAP